MILLIAVACVIMGLYVMRLIFLQLVNGDDFKRKDHDLPAESVRRYLPQVCDRIGACINP